MSDNIPPEIVQQVFELPPEMWTDIFKLLSRSILVQKIAPICYYFNEISNKNVKNIHVITEADQYTYKLNRDDPEANQQLEHLAENDCSLAAQFRASDWIKIYEKSQAILRHCPELFKGCRFTLFFDEYNKESTFFLECLTELEKAKPVQILVKQKLHYEDPVIHYLHLPTFQHCTRVHLAFWHPLADATMLSIVEWLHLGTNCDGQQVRCMQISSFTEPVHIDWLVNRCSEIIQSRGPIARRAFVLSFECQDQKYWPGFDQFPRRIENKLTGEVLLLDHDHAMISSGKPSYKLRRCLAEEEEANGPEFYTGMFKCAGGIEQFKVENEDEIPKVTIIG